MIITSGCFNPRKIHHFFWRVDVNSRCDWYKEDKLRTGLKPPSLLSTIAAAKHDNQLPKLITKRNVNDSFMSTMEWPYYRVTDTKMRPSIGWCQTKYHDDADKNRFEKSIFASELYVWSPNDRASLPNILGEMIANGLMNFHSTTHLSPSLVLLMVAWVYGCSWNWNWDKVPLLMDSVTCSGRIGNSTSHSYNSRSVYSDWFE